MNTPTSMGTVLLLLVCSNHCTAQGPASGLGHMKTCGSISLARSGFGVSYQGTVRNSDYGLSLVIPPSLVGWGAADTAPFHGFTIFLPNTGKVKACIVFEIHLRVPLGGAEPGFTDHRGERRVRVGNLEGWRREKTGQIDGANLQNVLVEFAFRRNTETFDGEVWLVTPLGRAANDNSILRAFLSHMHFDGTP